MEQFKTKLLRFPYKLADDVSLVATLGNFDGIHIGHQALLSKVAEVKKLYSNYKSAVISFYPHPAIVLGKTKILPRITTVREMLSIFSALEIDYLIMLHFTPAMLKVSAKDFINDYLFSKFHIHHLIVGPDARIGHKGEGDVSFLAEEFNACKHKFEVVPFVDSSGIRISSRLIRSLIENGEVRKVSSMLGRNYSLIGKVVKGDQRGVQLGFPTANLHVSPRSILPAYGVYSTSCKVDRINYKAVTNIGVRPTFNGKELRIETHLLDFPQRNLYGKSLEIEFFEKIRDERRFANQQELITQISSDIEKARTYHDRQYSHLCISRY